MNTRAPFDTGQCCTGNNDAIVDHLLGNAYQVVKFVAMRMPFIKTVSDNIESVIAIATALDKLKALEEKLPELLALRDKLNQLMEIYAHLNELLLISTNMNALLSVHDNLANIQLIATNISQLQTCAANIQSIATVSANIGSVNTVATDIAQVKVVAADIVAVRAVAADIASVKNVSTNMPKLTAIHAELPQLSANSADIAAFKSGTGSTKIGHTPASGGATTVDAALEGLRTDVDGKAAKANTLGGYGITDAYTKTEGDGRYAANATTLNGYGITDAYTKTEADNKLTQKVDKTAALGGGGDPTDAKASRALSNWYTNTAARPIQVTMAVNPEVAGGCVLSGYVRSAAGQTQFLVGATTLNGLTTSDRVAVSFLVPAGWQFQVDHFNAGVITSWTEF